MKIVSNRQLDNAVASLNKIKACQKHEPDFSRSEKWSDGRYAYACHKCGVWISAGEWQKKGFKIPGLKAKHFDV